MPNLRRSLQPRADGETKIQLRCGGRALVLLQEAGLERSLVGALSHAPSGLTFWVNVNFAVMAAAYLELQAMTRGERGVWC